jgi:ABC-type branched-subunit amino acid transport system ATPase component
MSAARMSVDGVTVRYGESVAVRDVSFDVPAGEVVGIVGANGAGKSSLLMSMNGLVPIASGSVAVDGRPLPREPWKIARTGVRFVSEERHLFPDLTVAQHLEVATLRGGAEPKAAIERALSIFTGLEPLIHRRAAFLSGGERSMLAVARAVVANPRVLVLDEPTLGLAPIATEQLIAALRRIKREGMTILLSEQGLALPRALCDVLIVMRLGALVERGKTATVLASENLRDVLI